MSGEALTIALNHSRAKGTAKVVLIGIANHDGDGGSWPSVKTLARYANVDDRTVQRAIDQLEKLGEIRRLVQRGGTHLTADSHRPNLYEFLLRCPRDCDGTKQHRTRKQIHAAPSPIQALADYGIDPVTPVSPGDASVTGRVTPVSPAPVTPVSPEPSREPTTKDSETKPAYRASVRVPVWADDRCPADWKTRTHNLRRATGKCEHCNERPVAFADATTGELT